MGKKYRILLLDDDDFTHMFFERMIADYEQVEAVCCSRPEEAKKALADGEFNMLVTDYYMPGIEGPEFLSSLGGLPDHTKVFLLTGADPEVVSRSAAKHQCVYNGIVSKNDLKKWLLDVCASVSS